MLTASVSSYEGYLFSHLSVAPPGAVNDGTTCPVDLVQSSGRDSVIEVTIIKSLVEVDLYNTRNFFSVF